MGIFDNRTPFFDEHFWYRIAYSLMHEVKRVKEEARLNGLTAQEYVRLERLVKLFHETHDYYAQPATRWTQEQWRKEQDAAILAAKQHNPATCGCVYKGLDVWSCGHIDNDIYEVLP